MPSTEQKSIPYNDHENTDFPLVAAPCNSIQETSVGRVGHEHPPLKHSKTPISEDGGAKSGAHDAPKPVFDPDLQKIISAWPELPEHIKAAVKALIQSHKKDMK